MKTINDTSYVHKQYADNYFSKIKDYTAAKNLVKDFVYTIVKYCSTTGDFSFTYSPDFDTASEPLVSDSILVKKDGSVKFIKQQKDPFIYHKKELFVEPEYTGFDYNAACSRSSLIDSIPNLDKTRIGRLSYWQANILPILGKMAKKYDEKTIGQYFIEFFGFKPTIRTTRFAQYILSKKDIETLVLDWAKHTWVLKTGGAVKSVSQRSFHPTARDRYSLTVPIAKYLEKNKPAVKVLYHGVGRDSLGAKYLNAESYDPYHPIAEIRKEPTQQYDEIHSHYTLNVVNAEEGKEILMHIYSLLTNKGKAVISVRRDF